jgi:hypothetical protein
MKTLTPDSLALFGRAPCQLQTGAMKMTQTNITQKLAAALADTNPSYDTCAAQEAWQTVRDAVAAVLEAELTDFDRAAFNRATWGEPAPLVADFDIDWDF